MHGGGLIDPRNKILRRPDVLAAIKRGERVWPLHVEMDISNACNLGCDWCAFAHTHDGALMPLRLAESILGQIAAAGVEAVTLTGGGEPTVNPAFAAVARAARDRGLRLGLYTNGLNRAALLDARGCFDWIYVSLDAAGPSEYRMAKRVDGFGRVCETVAALAVGRDGPALAVGVGFLLHAGNWLQAPQMVALSRGLGADYCQFRPVVGLDDYRWVPEALEMMASLQCEGVYVSTDRFREMLCFERSYRICRGSELVPCIGADGTLWVCTNTRGLRSLGSLAREPFGVLWSRRRRQDVGADCREACRNHYLNETLEYVCSEGPHDAFV